MRKSDLAFSFEISIEPNDTITNNLFNDHLITIISSGNLLECEVKDINTEQVIYREAKTLTSLSSMDTDKLLKKAQEFVYEREQIQAPTM